MEEIEVPLEHVQEELHHHAHESRDRWISMVALTSALLAVLAAVTALLAGHYSNEAMLEQIHASDTWSHYQAKSIKALVLGSKIDTLTALKLPTPEKDAEKVSEYKKELSEIEGEARELETKSKIFLHLHEIFARGVTFFQVAIGIAAVAVLTRRRLFWYFGLGFSLLGTLFLIQGLLSQHSI
jgi:hypothetical protein